MSSRATRRMRRGARSSARLEQGAFNPRVAGSNPAGPTILRPASARSAVVSASVRSPTASLRPCATPGHWNRSSRTASACSTAASPPSWNAAAPISSTRSGRRRCCWSRPRRSSMCTARTSKPEPTLRSPRATRRASRGSRHAASTGQEPQPCCNGASSSHRKPATSGSRRPKRPRSTARVRSWPHRSGRMARCSPTDPSTGATTASHGKR